MTKNQRKNGKKVHQIMICKKKETPAEKFTRMILIAASEYYRECLSENIRRGIAAKKRRNEFLA